MNTPSNEELRQSLDQAFDHVDAPAALVVSGSGEPGPAAAPVRVPELAETTPPRMPLVFGLVLVMVGFALAVAPFLGLSDRVVGQLAALGLTPALPFLTGIVLTGISWAHRQGGRSTAGALYGALAGNLAELRTEVRSVAEQARSLPASVAPSPVLDEAVAHLAKYEAMIGNLTKAVRMHSKPLVDLVGMATDQTDRLAELDKTLLAIKLDLEAVEKAVGESLTTGEKKWEGMFARLHGSETELSEGLAKNREMLIERIEPRIAEEVHRLQGEIETQWDLLREQIEKGFEDLEERTLGEIRSLGSRSGRTDPSPQAAPRPDPAVTAATAAVAAAPQAGSSGTGANVLSAIERLKRMRGGGTSA